MLFFVGHLFVLPSNLKKTGAWDIRTSGELGEHDFLVDAAETPAAIPPAISELRNEPSRPRVSTAAAGLAKLSNGAGAASKPAPAQREMAFGQAKLRDLIKKYQGQPTK